VHDDNAGGNDHSSSSSSRKQQYLSMAALFEAANNDANNTVPSMNEHSDDTSTAISKDEGFTVATQTDWSILPTVAMQYSTLANTEYSPLVYQQHSNSYHHQSYSDGHHSQNHTADDIDAPSTPSMQHTSSVNSDAVDTPQLLPSSSTSIAQQLSAQLRPNSIRARQSCMITPGKSCMSTATSASKSVQWSRQLTERFSPQFDGLSPITARPQSDHLNTDTAAAVAATAADSVHTETSCEHAAVLQAEERSWIEQHSNDLATSVAKSLFSQSSTACAAEEHASILQQHAPRDDADDSDAWQEHNDGSATFTRMASLSLNSSYRRLSSGSWQFDDAQNRQQQLTAVQHASQRSADSAHQNRNTNDDNDDEVLSQWTGFLGSPNNIENQQFVLYSRSVKDTSDRLLVSSNSSSPLSWQGSPVSTYTNTRQAFQYSDHQRSPLTDISLSESTEYWRQRLRTIDWG
jgi:hypothetical protein